MDSQRSFAAWVIAAVALAVVLLYAAYTARWVLVLLYISGLLAIGLSPLVRRMERWRLPFSRDRRLPRGLAILLIYVIVLGAFAALVVLVLPAIRAQARDLWAALPGMFERAQRYLVSVGVLQQPLSLEEVFARAPIGGSDAVNTVVSAASGVAGLVLGVVTVLILTFYLLLDSQSIVRSFIALFPRARRQEIADASTEVTEKVSAWLNGQLILMAIIGVSAAVGLGLMGVPFFYVLAIIAGIGELIPVVGPILAAVPAIVVGLNESYQLALAIAVFFLVQQQVENHVLVPKIMERQVGVSAVTVIVALLVGSALLGLLGAILAVPTAAILQVAYQRIIFDSPPRNTGDR